MLIIKVKLISNYAHFKVKGIYHILTTLEIIFYYIDIYLQTSYNIKE